MNKKLLMENWSIIKIVRMFEKTFNQKFLIQQTILFLLLI